MKRRFALLLVPFLISTPTAQGGDQAPLVTKRQVRQQAHINQAVQSGELTPQQAATLRDQQRAIAARRRNMEADGKLNKTERKLLRYEQQSARNALKRERGDAGKP